MDIKKQYLENEEYYHDVVTKKTIYLHHTAGSHRPDWVVASWERDKTGSGGVRHTMHILQHKFKQPKNLLLN